MKTAMQMHVHTEVAKRLEASLTTIQVLAEVLIANGGCKGHSADDNEAQIDIRGEEGIHQAILLITSMAHRDFCQLATDLGIPQ